MRLIDADELKEHLFVGADYDKAINDGIGKTEEEVFAFKCGWNDALASVMDYAPTVDAVEVVRCKDCKYYEETGGGGIGTCLLTISGAQVNGFCAWAERKEDVFN